MSRELVPTNSPSSETLEGTIITAGEIAAKANTIRAREYDNAYTFADAMREQRPQRVFSYAEATFDGNRQQVSFMGTDRSMHGYGAVVHTREEQIAMTNTIWSAIEEIEASEADGKINYDPQSGHIYQIFEADETTNEADGYAAQVNNWLTAVGETVADTTNETGYVQYLANANATTTVDFTRGNLHMVTTLNSRAGHDIHTVQAAFPDVALQDNAPVVRWQQFIQS
jgi:hypothetical protein